MEKVGKKTKQVREEVTEGLAGVVERSYSAT
jgi:hypothetical protein